MSESLMDKKSSLHDILRITEGEDVDIDRVHQHFIDYPYLELWVGKFFSDTSTATVDRERMTERLQAIFDALSSGGDQCTLHTGIGQAIVLDMASADIGKQLVSRAYRDLDIEGDEEGYGSVMVLMEQEGYEYRVRVEGDFWTERDWNIEGEIIEDARLTTEQRDFLESTEADPETSDISYKLEAIIGITKKQPESDRIETE